MDKLRNDRNRISYLTHERDVDPQGISDLDFNNAPPNAGPDSGDPALAFGPGPFSRPPYLQQQTYPAPGGTIGSGLPWQGGPIAQHGGTFAPGAATARATAPGLGNIDSSLTQAVKNHELQKQKALKQIVEGVLEHARGTHTKLKGEPIKQRVREAIRTHNKNHPELKLDEDAALSLHDQMAIRKPRSNRMFNISEAEWDAFRQHYQDRFGLPPQ